MMRLFKNSRDSGQYVLHDFIGQGVHFAAMPGVQVKDARLIATYNPCGADSGKRNGKANASGEVASCGDRADYRQSGCDVEGVY